MSMDEMSDAELLAIAEGVEAPETEPWPAELIGRVEALSKRLPRTRHASS